jgi:hypothetical protein
MNPSLEHLARRVADAPDFLACALAEYVRSEKLDDAGLAARLACPVEALTHLRLCRMPRTEAPQFWQDVEQIARRFAVDPDALAEITRLGQSLWHLRHPAGGGSQGQRFLLAARDESTGSDPTGGART